ncbi:hypothetical protein E2562_020797 [Oryza meyeriana var. granulata]|uniref:DUF679 domain-containing protein n=1 Tax=Oryza meyeriana var. granulata TaxID=110450 RepID=A0A6G1CG48_9ORYZ|nr:hypothetical protein E2562_020797 [Oryza meyeriana var. granulata]
MASSAAVRQRPTIGKQAGEGDRAAAAGSAGDGGGHPPARPSLFSQALASTASLANLLPTGTVMAFQLLAPTFTNNGACDATTALLTGGLLAVLALSCVLASFTDSVRGTDGRVYYGLATPRGLWLFDYPTTGAGVSPPPDTSRYRLRAIDGVHAALSAAVFGVVAARDKNVVGCFWPAPATETEEVLGIVPLGVGVICSLLFVAFPTTRHGIGYPVTNTS